MENNKLIGMREFVLSQKSELKKWGLSEEPRLFRRVMNYAEFLSKPLELGFFVPTSKDGSVLEIIPFHEHGKGSTFEAMQHWEFEEALSRCLFEGFEVIPTRGGYTCVTNKINEITLDQYGYWVQPFDSVDGCRVKNIEDLVPYGLTLTQTALKEIGL